MGSKRVGSRTFPSIGVRMNNPHRFPRPSTLPQPKIQIKPQRDSKSVDTVAPPTFASMLGRNLGGNTGVEDPISTGAFTTSFDLLSIAKVIPAKQRVVNNPVTIMEGQAQDRNTFGEQYVESQSGDWPRYMTSAVGFGTATHSQIQENPKSMIFRRHGTASSSKHTISHHRPDATPQPTRGEDNVKHGQPKVVGTPSEGNEDSSNGGNDNPPPDRFAEKVMDNNFEEPDNFSKINSLPTPGPLDFNSQGNLGIEREAEPQGGQNPKDATNETAGIIGDKLELSRLTEPGRATGTQAPAPPISDSNQLLSHMNALKNMNDGGAMLRAAAIPFEPKQVKKQNQFSSVLSNTGIEDIYRNRLQSENFTHLSDKFYGKTFNPSGEGPGVPSKEQSQWFIENSHHRLQMAIQNSGSESNGGSLRLRGKRARLSDAAISQLWDDHESEGNAMDSLSECAKG